MIAVDTNAWRSYLRGAIDGHAALIAEAVNEGEAALPPIVLTEALSYSEITSAHIRMTLTIPLMPLHRGFWLRAGNMRRNLISSGLKAPIADCLIAQACIDNDAPLITYDAGFSRFLDAGLKLL